jgi:hypothetical protein
MTAIEKEELVVDVTVVRPLGLCIEWSLRK